VSGQLNALAPEPVWRRWRNILHITVLWLQLQVSKRTAQNIKGGALLCVVSEPDIYKEISCFLYMTYASFFSYCLCYYLMKAVTFRVISVLLCVGEQKHTNRNRRVLKTKRFNIFLLIYVSFLKAFLYYNKHNHRNIITAW
jgi:predicted secreted protein